MKVLDYFFVFNRAFKNIHIFVIINISLYIAFLFLDCFITYLINTNESPAMLP